MLESDTNSKELVEIDSTIVTEIIPPDIASSLALRSANFASLERAGVAAETGEAAADGVAVALALAGIFCFELIEY